MFLIKYPESYDVFNFCTQNPTFLFPNVSYRILHGHFHKHKDQQHKNDTIYSAPLPLSIAVKIKSKYNH